MRLPEQLAARQLVVFLGPGGVGKTTVSAAAALEAARTRRTLVFTIDPARRLADALGVRVGSEPVSVGPNLDALMLDTKKALDELIELYAPNAQTMKRIFESRFYQNLSDTFAGSEEFVAMGALHELVHSGRWDTIVVDTPPSRHAVDFLAVNRKLIRVFESGVVKYVFKPTRVLRMGGGYLAGALAKWTSQQYLEEVSEFVVTFDQMFADMEKRVRAMQALMSDRTRTGINLVTSPQREVVEATLRLHEAVAEVGFRVENCVVNRHYPRLRGVENFSDLAKAGRYREGALKILHEDLGVGKEGEAFLDDVARAATFWDALAVEHEREVGVLRRELDVPLLLVPVLAGSIHDLAGLERLRERLAA